MMERMIVQCYKVNEFVFIDDPEDYEREFGYVDVEKEIGFHGCKKSALYEDLTGYVDGLQKEKELDDNKRYIVTYFKVDEHFDLLQLVDWNITKEQIIQNVINQKYLEGADYFYIDQFVRY